jgi:hypothetical protein
MGCAAPAAPPNPVVAPAAAQVSAGASVDRSRARPELDPEQPEFWATHVGEPDRFKELFERLEKFVMPERDCCEAVDANDFSARAQERLRGERIAVPLTRNGDSSC